MNTNVYSFSSKKEDEIELLNNLKARSKKTGVSFSYFILKALDNQYNQDGTNKKDIS